MVKKILISQPTPTAPKSPYFDLQEKYGVELTFHPFIKVEGLTAQEFRKQKVHILDHSAVVFYSKHAIDHFFQLCKELRLTVPAEMKYFGLSEQLTLYIQKYVQYRKRKVFFGNTGRWPELLQVMAKHKTENYLVPQSDVHTDELREMLDSKKLQHTECVMYRTVSNVLPAELKAYDMIVLFTPSGVQALCHGYENFEQGDLKIACFGKATAQAVHDAGLRLDLEAPTVEALSMAAALDQYLAKENA